MCKIPLCCSLKTGHFYSALVKKQRIVISLTVCLFISLFVCLAGQISLEARDLPLLNFCVFLMASSSWRRCDKLCPSGFVDDVT